MGHTLLTLSSRLSDDYVTRLLEKGRADVIIHDRPFVQPTKPLKALPLARQDQLISVQIRPEKELICDPSVIKGDDTLFINHSSGSTSLPKLLPFSNDMWVTKITHYQTTFQDDHREWAASAMYNYVGFMMLCRSLQKTACSFFENDRTHFTQAGAVAFLNEAHPHDLHVTPWTLGVLASTPQGIDAIKKCETVRTFGAVCPDALGDMLVRRGIDLSSSFGATETGLSMTSRFRPAGDDEWSWLSPTPHMKPWVDLRRLDTADGLYELVILPGCPDLLQSVQAEDGSYATGDLFLKHPTKPDRWKVVGRKDDQLKIYKDDRQVLVNAILYEQKISSAINDVADDVVLFGIGRGKLGVLVFAEGAEEGSKKARRIAERTWVSIQQQINGTMPVGIEKDMIVVVGTERAALPQTGKFNLIRAQVYLQFKDLIAQAYERPSRSPAHEQVPVQFSGRL